MGRNLTPVVQQELANLDKDPDSRKSAMKALKSYVKHLDCKAIPVFLAKVSETKETGSLSGEFTISLYEVLARVHGVKIVPMIDSIMVSIVQTLASSAGSFPLHQACSRVVPAIARYGIDPTAPEDKKREIIHSICKPLSDSLSSSQDSLTSGAALCLKALVDSDNWRFASSEMVNRVCQNVAVALEGKSTQPNSHMGLVSSLVKRNALVVEAYARLLIQSGLRILNAGHEECNSHKRLSAIQMVNMLMKCLDPRSVFSELDSVIEEMEKCQSDKMAFVKGAAFEALQTAKRIATEKKPRYVKSPASVTGSNFSTIDFMEGENSESMSPESCTIDFFSGYESGSVAKSSISTGQYRRNSDYERSVNRKLWSYENGGVDVSLKDGLFSKAGQESPLLEQSGSNEFPLGNGELSEEFSGFVHRNPLNGVSKSANTSPLRSRSQTTVELINIFETPRKLIQSLQDPSDDSPGSSEKQNRRYRSLSSSNIDWSPTSELDENGSSDHANCDCKVNQSDDDNFKSDSESVSSTDDLPADAKTATNVVPENKNIVQTGSTEKVLHKTKRKLLCGFSFALLAIATPLIWISSQQDQGHYLVPT